jgi:hypothetical protein
MSDYVSELRRDLVEAAERQAQRGRAGRVSRPLHPRAWSPTALAGAAAVAAAIVAVVVTLTTLAPPPQPSDAKIVATVHLGGQPRDAVLAGGSLWIVEFEGHVVRLDPATHRIRSRIAVGGTPVSVTAAGGAVWVISVDNNHDGGDRSHLYELDARTGRILDRVAVNGWAGAIAAGTGGLWLVPSIHSGNVERIDLDSHRRTALAANMSTQDLAVSGQSVWTRREDSILEIDATSGRVVNRVRGISSIANATSSARTLVPDRDGAWVAGGSDGLLLRVEGGRVVRRIAVGTTAGVVARAGSTVWVSATSGPDRYQLVRVDPDDGKVIQRVNFGFDVPQTLVPDGKDLWVITSGGEAKLLSPE